MRSYGDVDGTTARWGPYCHFFPASQSADFLAGSLRRIQEELFIVGLFYTPRKRLGV